VSSLRKLNGALDKIQVAGGMDPGNSGGPVIDESGHVVGVAVSGIPGRMINFAIPAQRVHSILEGRISEMGVGQPFRNGEKIGLPITMVMIDPRTRIKDVGLEVWTGNAPNLRSPRRPATRTAPPAATGDSTHQRTPLSFAGGVGRGEVILPELPPGKVYWVQPFWTHKSGQTRWASANVYKVVGSPLERKPLDLNGRYFTTGSPRRVDVSCVTRLRVGAEAETEIMAITTKASMSETGTRNGAGVRLRLGYQSAEQTAVAGKRTSANPKLAAVRPQIKNLIGLVELDAGGNIRLNAVDNLVKMRLSQTGRDLIEVHEPIQQALSPLLLPMPNRKVNALESWKITRLIGVETPEIVPMGELGGALRIGFQRGTLNLTCTYLGVRAQNGRDEALVLLEGDVREGTLTGRARGMVVVDVSTGIIRQVDLNMDLDVPPVEVEAEGKAEKLRLLSVVTMKLTRSL
jgi:hypothetical protein